MVQVSFFGVRGSAAAPGDDTRRYGGNTSCVVVDAPDHEPIVCDLGTGLRRWARTQPLDGSFRATALLTHLHWDHIQGFPFFAPLDRAGAHLTLYGPAQEAMTLCEAFDRLMGPPFFPIRAADLRGTVEFHDLPGSAPVEFDVGRARVRAVAVPHIGLTIGYRIELDGVSVAYVSDVQQPLDGSGPDPAVVDLVRGVDVLIHDAQYTPVDWETKCTWGHSTIDHALLTAKAAGVGTLALFHHDPARSDDELDAISLVMTEHSAELGLEVLVATEGCTLDLNAAVPTQLSAITRH